jgi:hypothetical protein
MLLDSNFSHLGSSPCFSPPATHIALPLVEYLSNLAPDRTQELVRSQCFAEGSSRLHAPIPIQTKTALNVVRQWAWNRMIPPPSMDCQIDLILTLSGQHHRMEHVPLPDIL